MSIYNFLKAYVWLGLRFYFSKIITVGKERIPKTGAVVFLANHQNAFLDALLIATSNKRPIHYLARADVFRNSFVKKLLKTIHMMPIFRIRDGWNSLSKNETIFNDCYNLLNNQNALLLFPEGNHGGKRRLRPLSKGFTRIVFGAIDKYPELDIQIIPVGINYQEHNAFRSKVSVYYGEPIPVNQYLNKDHIAQSSSSLKSNVKQHMSQLITHIEDEKRYEELITTLEAKKFDFLNPVEVNEAVKELTEGKEVMEKPRANFNFRKLFFPFIWLNNLLPITIWEIIKGKIKDPVFVGSMRFTIGITIFPLFFILQSLIVNYFLGMQAMMIYAVLSLVVLLVSANSK